MKSFDPCPDNFNMAHYVLQAGLLSPDKPALEVLGGRVWSHSNIRDAVTRLGGGLRGLGIKSGAKVMIRLGNRVEFPILYLACIWVGLIPVPTSAQLGRAEITAIADELIPDLIVGEDGIDLPTTKAPILHLHELQGLMEAAPDAPACAPVMGDPERFAYIIFTSGTSGKPRGVCHAHRAIWARRMMFDGWYGLRRDDRVLHAGAFNWSYTMGTGLMDPWTIGATALIPQDGMRPDDLARAIGTSQATIFAGAPGVYRQLLKSDDLAPSSTLRHGLSAGESLPHNLRARWADHMGCDIHEALGMSECSTFISSNPDETAPAGTSGRPQTGRKITVTDAGVLAVHHTDAGLMLGYLNDPNPLPEWFETGDTVAQSDDGWITYLGRNDDIITAGGYRISPMEIEAAFTDLKDVDECAAVQVRIKADTTLIALFYTSKTPLDETHLRAHAQSLLASYKQPRLYIHRLTLPKGANGKLNRRTLRTEFEADL